MKREKNGGAKSVVAVVFALACTTWMGGSALCAEALQLVKDGKPVATVVKGEDCGQGLGLLLNYIRKSTGARLPVVNDGAKVEGTAIHVGNTKFVKSLNLPLKTMDREGIVLKRTGQNLVITGASPLGISNAAKIFLEDVVGVRWYIPGDIWWVIPETKDLSVGELDRVESPDFFNRDSTGMAFENWMRWNRMNYPSRCSIGHNIGKVVDPKIYGKTHPEYYPLIGGKRAIPKVKGKKGYADWQPCLSNPELVDIAVKAAQAYFAERPDSKVFSLAQNDNYGWCRCEKCIEMNGGLKFDEAGHMCFSNLYFRFLNKVCEKLQKTHPDKLIGTMAYQCGTYDPPEFKAHPNIVVLVVNSRSRFHFDEEFRKAESEYIKSWAAVSNHLALHNWHFGKRYMIPVLELKSTRDFLQFAHANGATSYHGEEYPNWGIEGPKTWITAQLLWNVDADLDALLQRFCDDCFGKAGPPMKRFYEILEAAWNNQPDFGLPLNILPLWREDPRQLQIITPGTVEDCRKCLEEAFALVEDDLARQRLEHVAKTFRMVDYFTVRNAVYRGLDPQKHLTPASFQELVHNFNRMEYATDAFRIYIAENIKNDPLTYCGGWPGYVHMDLYYCEFGSQIAEALAKAEVESGKPSSQKALITALNKRFGELTANVAKADARGQGPAWEPFKERLHNYLQATAFVPRLKDSPKIDGTITAEEWKAAPVLTGFYKFHRRTLPEKVGMQTEVRVAYDDKGLYLAYRLFEEDISRLADKNNKRD
jgi:hypothetical protein